MSKYHAIRVRVDGHLFHSQREAGRYQELRLLERAGEIQRLVCQPAFDLHAISADGEVIRLGKLILDFSYLDTRSDRMVYEDVKGMATLPLAKWKQKHCAAEYGITITEVR